MNSDNCLPAEPVAIEVASDPLNNWNPFTASKSANPKLAAGTEITWYKLDIADPE